MAAAKRSNNLLIVIGLVFLLVGTGLVLVLLRDDGAGDGGSGTAAGSDLVDVVVSKEAIARGTDAKDIAGKVEVRKVAAVTRPSDAITSLSELADRRSTVDIGQGQQLRAIFFQQGPLRSGSVRIPQGKQAMAVTVPFTPAGAGYVGQGDLVNVFATMSTQGGRIVPRCGPGLCDNPGGTQPQAEARLILSNVEVLDVSQEVAPNVDNTTASTVAGTTARPLGPASITYLLAVDPGQSERLVFYTSYAELYLSLVPQGQAPASGAGRTQTNSLNP